jgi:hypothetical protein
MFGVRGIGGAGLRLCVLWLWAVGGCGCGGGVKGYHIS